MWDEHKARLGLGPIEGPAPAPAGVLGEAPAPEPTTDTSFGEAFSAARQLYNTVPVLKRWYDEQQIPRDPDYKLESNYNELIKNVPQIYQGPLREHLVDAKSADHAWSIRDNFMFEVDQQETIAKQGWKGAAATLAAGVLDEGAVGLTLLGPTAFLARSAKIARAVNLASRPNRIAAYAVAGAAENASIEAVTVAASKTRSPYDVGYAAAFGAIFGGVAGNFIPARPHPKAPEVGIDMPEPNIAKPGDNAIKDMDATIEANARGDDAIIDHPVTNRFNEDEAIGLRQTLGEDPLPEARPIADVREPTQARAAAQSAEEVRTINARIKELAAEDVPIPVRPTLATELDKVKKSLAEASPEDALNPVQRTRQQQKLTNERRHFMTVLQKEDPDTYAELGLGRNPSAKDFELLITKGSKKLVARVEKAYKRDVAEADARFEAIDKETAKLTERLNALQKPEAGPSGSLGAAAVDIEPRAIADISTAEYDEFVENAPDYVPFANGIRKYTSTFAKLAADPNIAVRWINSKLLTDHVGGPVGTVAQHSANVMKEDFERTVMATFTRDHKDAYNQWMKDQGIPFWSRKISNQMRQREFGTQVTDLIEGFGAGVGDPNVEKAAAATRKLYADTKNWAERAGLEGFDQFATNSQYSPHIHNSEAVRNFRSNYRLAEGAEERMKNWTVPEEMVYQGLRRSDPELDPETAALIARNYVDIVIKKDAGRRGQYFDMSRIGEEGYIENAFQALGIDEADMRAFLDLRERLIKPSESERVKYAKSRTALDMSTTIQARILKEDGSFEDAQIALKDMFHRDAGALAHSYIRSVGGRAAIAEATKGTAFHITSDKKWNDLIEKTRQMGLDEGVTGDEVRASLDTLEMVRNLMVGIPVLPNDDFTRMTSTILRYNFVGRMGQTAFAQLSEMGNMQAQIGTWNMIRMIPEMARFYGKRGVDGRLSNELARFAEEEMAAGGEAALGKHFADHITDVEVLEGRVPLADNLLHTAERVVGYPMRKVMAYQQRMLNIGMLHQLDDIANGRLPFYEGGSLQRWADVGLSEADMRNVVEQFRMHAQHNGRLLLNPGHEQWDDYGLWLKFRRGMFRMTRRSIQENDISNLPAWLHGNRLAKLAVQFRTFTIGAIEKQLLFNVNKIAQNPKDAEAWATLAYQTMWAGMAYAAMVEGKAILKPEAEREEFQKKYLTLDRIAAASFARAGYSTLIPGTIDTTLWIAGADPVFSLSRGSGLQQNFITGNPTVQLSQNVMKAARGVVAPIINPDYQFSRQDLRAWQSVLPFSTLPGVYNLWNAAPQLFDLPTSSTEE